LRSVRDSGGLIDLTAYTYIETRSDVTDAFTVVFLDIGKKAKNADAQHYPVESRECRRMKRVFSFTFGRAGIARSDG